ncbi:hypothetical protein XU18_4972 [Perkinsela sp. CCAP 1560/4]|nr:hypothetical protein XU18_4972 [Perkinsela sp. CCAP 1560/4]|eukprot:KNH03702.1 hypothetical protein XU18_4972 [Perkinsela sp. CCAP 1560/4]
MSIALKDLELVLNMLAHENLQIVKQAIDVLLNYFQGTNLEKNAATMSLLSDEHGHNLMQLLNLTSYDTIADKSLALLINLAATGDPFIITRICELGYMAVLIEVLEKEGIVSTSAPDFNFEIMNRQVNRNRVHLLLLLLVNLTSSEGDAAISSLMQLHVNRGVTDGFYVQCLLSYFKSNDQCQVTSKCLLYTVLNLSRNKEACSIIINQETFLRFIRCKLQKRQLLDEQNCVLLKLVRNMTLNQRNTEEAHKLLIDSSIADEVMHCFQACEAQADTTICKTLAETIYFICSSKDGIGWMDSINGKRSLQNALEAKNHPIVSEDCQNTRDLVEKLLPILDDIQDVYVSNSEHTDD